MHAYCVTSKQIVASVSQKHPKHVYRFVSLFEIRILGQVPKKNVTQIDLLFLLLYRNYQYFVNLNDQYHIKTSQNILPDLESPWFKNQPQFLLTAKNISLLNNQIS